MSHSASTPPRQRRGGRNRNRPAEHGSRDQHQSQRFQRDTETFQRPKGGPKLTLWQKILSAIGLGPKPPLRRADRPSLAAEPAQSEARPPRAQSPTERREPRDARPPREPREPREPKAPRPVIQHEVISGRLYVGNLSYDVAEADLSDLFGGVGQVQSVEIVVNRATQRSKGFAFVEMLTIDEAKRAVAELHDKEFMGRKMLVTGAKAADAPRSADGEGQPGEARPYEAREPRAPREPREAREPREPRSFEPRSSESHYGDSRPPRRESREPREFREPRESRESRATAGPSAGDVTTGIIRREQLAGSVVPPAGPVVLPAAAQVAPAMEPATESVEASPSES